MLGVLVEEWTEFENLTLKECPSPDLKPGQVRIKTQAAGVSFGMSLVVAGRYQRKPPLPFVPGTEVTGFVTEVADDVTDFKPGDRVASMLDWGGLAEEATAFTVNTFKLPDSLDFIRAICFTNSYGTSYSALTWPHLLNIKAGETLLVHGATGGVGIAAIEIGKIRGATVIATAGTDEKLAVAREHGADHTINYREGSFREPVLELTGGVGANVIYDPVGGDVFAQSLRCIAPEGRIMPVGFASGTIPQIPANILLVKNIIVCGFNYGLYVGWSPVDMRYEYADRVHASMTQLFAWFEEGRLSPRVSHTIALADFRQSMAAILGRQAIGRVAIVMDEEARRLGV